MEVTGNNLSLETDLSLDLRNDGSFSDRKDSIRFDCCGSHCANFSRLMQNSECVNKETSLI